MTEFKFEIIELEDGTKRKKVEASGTYTLNIYVHSFLNEGDVYEVIGYVETDVWTITNYMSPRGEKSISYTPGGDIQKAKVIVSHRLDTSLPEYPDSIVFMCRYDVAYFPVFSAKLIKPAIKM